MALINYTPPTDGETADASDVVTPLNTIYNEFNGNIDNTNVKSGAAIATSKLADDAGITTAKIADDAVTAAKVDWASTGTNAGIWWEELGRTTLGSAGDTISVTGLTARKYLKVLFSVTDTGGTINAFVRFNNDSGNNYAYASSTDGGTIGTSTSTSSIQTSVASSASPIIGSVEIVNIATTAKRTISQAQRSSNLASGAPSTHFGCGKWANTSDQITRIDLINGGTGDFAIGSEVVVLGHD